VSRVLVVGSTNMDLVMRCPRLPSPGETLGGGQFAVVPGGKGANQAASAARLGCKVRLLGAVGDDDFGTAARANLLAQGVQTTELAAVPGVATGVAMIVVDAAGENTIIVAAGANACLDPEAVSRATSAIDWCDAVVLQCEIPIESVAAAVAAARSRGKTVLVNAAPALPDLPLSVYAADYLVVNEHEAESLTGIRPLDEQTALAAAGALRARGAGCAVVTLGAAGCAYCDADESGHVPAPKVTVVDTTAAGDAFIGALAAALLRDMPLERALLYANCAGALAVTTAGAQPSLPDRAAVDALFGRIEGGTG
jgi:ribokinase